MKTLLCALTLTLSSQVFAARQPPAEFMHQTLSAAAEIMQLSSEKERRTQLCNLFDHSVHGVRVGTVLLGGYLNLRRDMNAITEFYAMVPSIVMGKALGTLGSQNGEFNGTFTVADQARSGGNGLYEVSVRAKSNGRNYNGKAIIFDAGNGRFLIVDGEYLGFSAVNMLKREYQRVLKKEYDKSPNTSLPVTKLVEHVKNQSDYINCN